jgi:hypothetical protein
VFVALMPPKTCQVFFLFQAQSGPFFIALREGKQEGYEGHPGAERWFSYFQAEKFESYIPGVYRITRSKRTDSWISDRLPLDELP